MKRNFLILAAALVLVYSTADSQARGNGKQTAQKTEKASKNTATADKKQLQTQKKEATNDLKKNQAEFARTKAETERYLEELELGEGQIVVLNGEIEVKQNSVDSVGTAIKSVSDTINSLDGRLKTLSDKYASALRKRQTSFRHASPLSYVFASKSVSGAVRRYRALKQFGKWRSKKAGEINGMKEVLETRRTELGQLKDREESLLNDLAAKKEDLTVTQQKNSELVATLKEKSSEIEAVMAVRRQELKQLDMQLESLIAAEQAKIAEERRKEKERLAAEKRRQEEEQRILAEKKRKEEEQRQLAEKRKKEEQERLLAEQRRRDEEAARKKAEEEAVRQQDLKRLQEQQLAQNTSKQTSSKTTEPVVIAARTTTNETPNDKPERKARGSNKVQSQTPASASSSASSTAAPKNENTPTVTYPKQSSSGQSELTARNATMLSTGFQSAKGNLPYPVDGKFVIVRNFGRQRHPELPMIETDNPGIDLSVNRGESARSIYEGEVSAIFQQPGYHSVVMVRHGDYLTVYANLENIRVKKGDRVAAGQVLGKVAVDEDDSNQRAILHFEIRHEKAKENPAYWLR